MTNLQEMMTKACKKPIAQCTDGELYHALLALAGEMAKEKESSAGKRKLY